MSEDVLVFGIHAVRTLLRRHPQRVSRLLLQKGREDARILELQQLAKEHRVQVQWNEVSQLNKLAGGERHQGACIYVRPAAVLGEGALDDLLDDLAEPPLLLILDGVQDPHNLGACLRTADAVGANAVIVPRDRAAGLSPTVRKVASGAADVLPLIQVVNLARTLRWLKERGVWIVGTDDAAKQSLYECDLSGSLALVLGAEGAGLRRLTRDSCDVLASIPMQGVVESLNVSVAAGVGLFEARRQRRQTGR